MTYFTDRVRFYSGVPGKCKQTFLSTVQPRNNEQELFRGLLEKLINGDFWAISVLGTVGNGKTTLACAAVNQWNDLHYFYEEGAYYTTQSDMILEYKDTFTGKTSEAQVFNRYARKAKFLVIDELNPKDWSEYNKGIIQKILLERYANERRTVLIGNLESKDFKAMFDPHIISRLREGETVYMIQADMRIKGVK